MSANPYASYVEGKDPLRVLAATPRRIEELTEELGAERLDQPYAPGKWSPREILCHLTDSELAFSFRARQALAEENHVIQPFDQDKWAATYAVYEAHDALALFCDARKWNMALFRSLTPEQKARAAVHPERGPLTVWTIVETIAGHDLHHLQKLESIAADFAPANLNKRSTPEV
ncbi:DinB family protein [Silvibacterium sp.]|uniref:DinB family protein n=1 Tax=Silvibacterium sp. TaxID=1964179 RepID=UPI0039E532D3